jgi:hypothetical protein
MLGPCTLDRSQHQILETEIGSWLKRNVENAEDARRLFVYRHMQTGNFIVAWWISKERGRFSELMNLGTSLSSFTREMARSFKQILSPQAGGKSAIEQQMKNAQYQELMAKQQEADEITARNNHYNKH